MSESSLIQFQQIVHINYLLTLPALSTLALLAPILWLIFLRWQRHRAEFKLIVPNSEKNSPRLEPALT
ncbi:MAG: hypothetical protein H0W63_06745 [Gemmatimonadaceae bacterium]|nr:hypothetical protein [Gemmatimonadaceae bacterium]